MNLCIYNFEYLVEVLLINQLILFIVVIVFFAYVGYTSNHQTTDIYRDALPSMVKETNDYSFLFIILLCILIGAYVFRKPLSKITGKLKDGHKDSNEHVTETPSEQATEEVVKEEPSGEIEEMPLEEPKSEEEKFEEKLKDTYES